MKKLHWGHKIGIVYTLFALFMIFMVLKSRTEKHELVTENYYENEVALQGKLDANNNLNTAAFNVNISSANHEILVSFDDLPSGDIPAGTVSLYKPDDSRLDETMAMLLDGNNKMLIKPLGNHGRYKVSLRFNISGTDYYKEKQIML